MTKPFARVAIVVRTKDRPLMLKRAIDDILRQTFHDWLMVIVNDGGNLESVRSILSDYSSRLSGRTITCDNPISLGMQTGSNRGIHACESDFIAIHDDDDTWDRTFLERTVSHLDQVQGNRLVGGVVTWSHVIVEQIIDDGDIVETDRFIFNDKLFGVSLVELGIENQFPPISFLFRRQTFEKVGDFREEFGVLGDWDFHLRVARDFQIDVLPEPLAQYHHRMAETVGVYANSVHILKDLHSAKRVELVNSYLRHQASAENASIAQVLLHGQLHRLNRREFQAGFKRLNERLHRLEQHLAEPKPRKSRRVFHEANLVENGDFRRWGKVGEVFPLKYSSHGLVCPGFLIAFDGNDATYSLERVVAGDEPGISPGKTYLRVVNKGGASSPGCFYLECVVSDVDAIAGRTIVVSGVGRISGTSSCMSVGGRVDFADGGKTRLSDKTIRLSDQFQSWSCTLQCPTVHATDIAGAVARIHMKLDYSKPFVFEITDIQAEVGERPTAFAYSSGAGGSVGSTGRLAKLAGPLLRQWTRPSR